MKIGLVGAGPLCVAIGKRLVERGIEVVCWNRTPARLKPLFEAGAAIARDLDELIQDTVMTMACVSDAAAIRAIFLSGQIDWGRRPDARIINLGTVGDADSAQLEEAFAALSITYTDMPVSGGVEAALAGTLAAYVGRRPSCSVEFDMLVSILASDTVRFDNNQMAQAMKVLNNLCEAVNLWGAAEAVVVGARFGFSVPVMAEGLVAGRGDSDYLRVLFRRLLIPSNDVAVSLATRLKDLDLALDMARRMHVDVHVAELTRRLFARTGEQFGVAADQVECYRYVAGAEYS